MARPIKETPVLKGDDAEKFLEAITRNETDTSGRVSREEYEKSKELYEKIMSNATFS